MKKLITAVLAAASLAAGAFVWGYFWGQRDSNRILRSAPLVFYVQDTWHDCRAIRELKKGNVEDVMHDLNMNLNQQIKQLWWIWKSAPSERDRDRSFQLLLDIATHRSDFRLLSPESKDGAWVHATLDEVEKVAKQKEGT